MPPALIRLALTLVLTLCTLRASGQADADASPKVAGDAPLAYEPSAPPRDEQPVEMADPLLMGLDPAALMGPDEPTYPALSLYGFADFGITKPFMRDDSVLGLYVAPRATFMVGNINLYVDSQISRRARSLIEVRFAFMPNGAPSVDPTTARVTRVNTAVTDYRIFGRPTQWGSIGIERVVLSYELAPWLTATVGRFITPWGQWNVDHGSPSLISVQAPIFIDSQHLPARQTGLQLSGQRAWPHLRAGYFLTLSNGRGPVDTYWDFDRNKALGGRVFTSFSHLGELTLGFTWLFGRATEPLEQYVRLPPGGGTAFVDTTRQSSFFEKSLAADLRWEYKGALLVTEFASSGRTYDNRYRTPADPAQAALVSDGRTQLLADGLRWGGYVLAGYRFKFLGTMPFVNFEYDREPEAFLGQRVLGQQFGLNIRPEPGLVLKLVASWIYFKDSNEIFFGRNYKLWSFNSQAAWAF